MESILTSVKKSLGIVEEYTHFDDVIVMHINTVFNTLTQLGVGDPDGFAIEDDMDTWESYIQSSILLNMIKSYMCMKVRLLFDPPQSTVAVQAIERQAEELEWRIYITTDTRREVG